MASLICEYILDDAGATAIEYGLIAALLSLAGLTALTSSGNALSAIFSAISDHMTNAAGGG